MTLTLTTHDDYTLARFAGSLDNASGHPLQAQLHPLLDVPGNIVLLDLSACERVGSAGLGHLVRLTGHANTRGARLVLVQLSPYLTDILRITRLDQFLATAPDVEQALAAARDASP